MKNIDKIVAGGAVCLCLFGVANVGECSSIESEQNKILRSMKINERNFGGNEKSVFNASKQKMKSDVQKRQREIEAAKKEMERKYANAASEYSMDAVKTPAVQPYEQQKIADIPASKLYTLPTQLGKTSNIRQSASTTDLELPSLAPETYVGSTSSLSDTAKNRIKQLGFVTGFLFLVMAGLRLIGRKEKRED